MKTVGIIAEFNPFHNGHSYLIEKAKKITGADNVVIVMSGNFVQRGAPAFMDKFTRTKMALLNGADLVIELPFVYASSSASYFAEGAVSILDKMNCVDYLCFGCENDDINLLKLIAHIILKEDDVYSSTLQTYLKNGLSFAASREKAIIKSLALIGVTTSSEEISTLLKSPNSILAIEYIKAIQNSGSNIVPVPVKREDHGYHSLKLSSGFASSSAIRNMYQKPSVYKFNNIKETLSTIVPANTLDLYEKYYKLSYPVYRNDFSELVVHSLISDRFRETDMNMLFDSSPDLINRIRNVYGTFTNIEDFISKCNSPTFPSSRIARLLFYSLIPYNKEDYFNFKKDGYVYYFRVLGFKKSHSELLKEIKNKSDIPLISKLSKADELLSDNENAKKMLLINKKIDEIYRMVCSSKYNYNLPSEEEFGVVIKQN